MPNNVSAPQDTIYVSTISINLAKVSRKTIESITLKKNNEPLRDVQRTIRAGGTHQEEFHPPLALGSNDHFLMSVNYGRWWKRVDISIDINLSDIGYVCNGSGLEQRVYRIREENVEIIAHYQLPASTTSILEACSQLRLLLIGNTGAGKSSLIHKVFGVESVDISQVTRGTADIHREFTSPTNVRFTVHDSLGFEAGDERNVDIVKQFIARRKTMSRRDQLHAIWLCLETPYCGSRLIEAGVEEILQKRDEVLGNIPLVVVLTKVDRLDLQLEIDLPQNETLENYKSRYLNEFCIEPLRRAAGSNITPVVVSVRDGYSESLINLVEAMKVDMAKYHVYEAPWFASSVAQRVSIKEKIELSIAIGKKEYWNVLLQSTVFRGHTLQECLHVIHKDIITVWNFNDPNKYLMDDKIFGALLRTNDLGDTADMQSNRASFADLLAPGLKLLEKDLSGSVDITPYLGFTAAVVKGPYKTYQPEGTKEDVKTLMVYIVNLICVMQAIFLLASGGRVTPQIVAFAVRGCERQRRSLQPLVDKFDGSRGVLLGGRDYVLEQVVGWIWRYSIRDDEIEELRRRIGQVLPSSSES